MNTTGLPRMIRNGASPFGVWSYEIEGTTDAYDPDPHPSDDSSMPEGNRKERRAAAAKLRNKKPAKAERVWA